MIRMGSRRAPDGMSGRGIKLQEDVKIVIQTGPRALADGKKKVEVKVRRSREGRERNHDMENGGRAGKK